MSTQPVLAEAITKALENGRVTRHTLAKGLTGVLEPSLVDCLTPEERRHAEWYLVCEGTRRGFLERAPQGAPPPGPDAAASPAVPDTPGDAAPAAIGRTPPPLASEEQVPVFVQFDD